MDELFSEFLIDSAERLDIAEAGLARFHEDPRGLDAAIHQIHTIRGAASFMAAPRISSLIEAAESMLLAARQHGALTAADSAAFARCAERVRGIIAGAQAAEPVGDDAALLEMLAAAEHSADRIDARAPMQTRTGAWEGLATEAAEARGTLAALDSITGEERAAIGGIIRTSEAVEAEARALRSVPMDNICRALPRLAQQAAALVDKQVDVIIEGGAIALDGPVAMEMRAVLVHLVRNAIAHGIESPSTRVARGKLASGTLRISARRDGEFVCIDVADDGAGIDLAAIRKRGVENGMIGAAQAFRLSDEETLGLLFSAGFSTARRVTTLSGCGIGLDAVKASIEKLGGRLAIESRAGAGLAYHMRLPQAAAAAAPIVMIDPSHPMHERLRPLLGAAGYEITEGIAVERIAAPMPSEDRKEQTA
ncbi:MAG: ATP-binding protein [Alphaproteobacteria bacterium]